MHGEGLLLPYSQVELSTHTFDSLRCQFNKNISMLLLGQCFDEKRNRSCDVLASPKIHNEQEGNPDGDLGDNVQFQCNPPKMLVLLTLSEGRRERKLSSN